MNSILGKILTTAAVYVGALLIEAMIREMSKVEERMDCDVHSEHVLDDDEFDGEENSNVHPFPGVEIGSRMVAEMRKYAEKNRVLPIILKSLKLEN